MTQNIKTFLTNWNHSHKKWQSHTFLVKSSYFASDNLVKAHTGNELMV